MIWRRFRLVRPGSRIISPPVKVNAVIPCMAEDPVQNDTDALFFCFFAQVYKIFFRTQERIYLFIVAGIVVMVAAAFKNRVQVQTGDAHVRQVIQFFPDAFQGAAEEIKIQNAAPRRVFDVAGQVVPASVEQRIGFAAELGQRNIPPVEAVRKNLVHHSLFHPVRRDRAPVVHRNLVRRRFLLVLLPPASQPGGVITVVKCFVPCFYNKIIPEQAAAFRRGNTADVTALFSRFFTGQGIGSLLRFCFFLQRQLFCVFSLRNDFIRPIFFFFCPLLPFPGFGLHGDQRFPGALLP